jgi:oxygen-independent coproporphyrinogen-3 oxidase
MKIEAPAALYIHIPFCKSICSYCDFYKLIAKDEIKEKYISYLIRELQSKKDYFANLKTIYIGGGTPSALQPQLLEKLLSEIKNLISLDRIEEYTLEANPNDITPDIVRVLKEGGINRLSLGVQSFQEERLQILGRTHREEDVRKALTLLRRGGFTNINIDLIYGLAADDFPKIKVDLKKAIRYGATHISAYSLIIEEKTILYKRFQEGSFQVLDEDKEAEIYRKLCHYLRRRGFRHYEISNFARKNYQSKHNLTYWNNMNYIGVGANSSYYLGRIRYTNINHLEKYFAGIESGNMLYREVLELSEQDVMGEEMLLGLRKIAGVNLKHFQEKFGVDAFTAFPVIRHLIGLKLLEVKVDHLRIPENKLYLSNEVLVNFI